MRFIPAAGNNFIVQSLFWLHQRDQADLLYKNNLRNIPLLNCISDICSMNRFYPKFFFHLCNCSYSFVFFVQQDGLQFVLEL